MEIYHRNISVVLNNLATKLEIALSNSLLPSGGWGVILLITLRYQFKQYTLNYATQKELRARVSKWLQVQAINLESLDLNPDSIINQLKDLQQVIQPF